MHVICRISFSLLFVMFCLLETSAQKSFQPKQVEFEWKGIIYRNESTLKGTLHTNGYSIAYNKGKIKSYYKTNYYHIELGHISDAREQKQNKNIPYQFSKISRSFKFGKQNSLYMIRAGKGTKTLLTDKTKRKGVAIGYNYEAGPAIAILKLRSSDGRKAGLQIYVAAPQLSSLKVTVTCGFTAGYLPPLLRSESQRDQHRRIASWTAL